MTALSASPRWSQPLPKVILGVKFSDGIEVVKIASSSRCRLTPTVTKKSAIAPETDRDAAECKSASANVAESRARRSLTRAGAQRYAQQIALRAHHRCNIANRDDLHCGVSAGD